MVGTKNGQTCMTIGQAVAVRNKNVGSIAGAIDTLCIGAIVLPHLLGAPCAGWGIVGSIPDMLNSPTFETATTAVCNFATHGVSAKLCKAAENFKTLKDIHR